MAHHLFCLVVCLFVFGSFFLSSSLSLYSFNGISYGLTATLGALPSACHLSSVPLYAGLQGTPGLSTSPATSTNVSWGSQGSGNTPVGMILSPALEPVPHKLVEKTRSGQFVDMKEFLADNMALTQQLEAIPGMLPIATLGATRPRLREVNSLSTWCYCFLGYMAIRTADPATRDQLTYARLLIREARRHGRSGWLAYDRAFRQQAAADPTLRWNTLIPGLQASTILGQRTSQGSFCTLCRDVDHSRSQCALACLEPASTSPTNAQPTRASRLYASWRRPESALNVCISWNKGNCVFPQSMYIPACVCHMPAVTYSKGLCKNPRIFSVQVNAGQYQRPPTTTPPTRQ